MMIYTIGIIETCMKANYFQTEPHTELNGHKNERLTYSIFVKSTTNSVL